MFDDKQINDYRRITAPDELRARVLGQKKAQWQRPILRYASLAACMVLILTAVLVFRPVDGITVSTSGIPVTAEGISLSAVSDGSTETPYSTARSVSTDDLEIPLTFEGTGTFDLYVSAGEVSLNGEKIALGDDAVTSDGELHLTWQIKNAGRGTYYSLVLVSDGNETVLTASYQNGWTIRLNEN